VEQGDGLRLIELWEKYETVFLIDALQTKNKKQDVVFMDILKEEIPRDVGLVSSHTFSLGETISLAKALGRLPKYFGFIGIPGKLFGISSELSLKNEKAINKLLIPIQHAIDQQIKLWAEEKKGK
jgi:hydrogenase maturation protease